MKSETIPNDLFSTRTIEDVRISARIRHIQDDIFRLLDKDNELYLRKTTELYQLTLKTSACWIGTFAFWVHVWIFLSGITLLVVGTIFNDGLVICMWSLIVWLISFSIYCLFVSTFSEYMNKAREQFRVYYDVRNLVKSLNYWLSKEKYRSDNRTRFKREEVNKTMTIARRRGDEDCMV